jgi:hypothetical protein
MTSREAIIEAKVQQMGRLVDGIYDVTAVVATAVESPMMQAINGYDLEAVTALVKRDDFTIKDDDDDMLIELLSVGPSVEWLDVIKLMHKKAVEQSRYWRDEQPTSHANAVRKLVGSRAAPEILDLFPVSGPEMFMFGFVKDKVVPERVILELMFPSCYELEDNPNREQIRALYKKIKSRLVGLKHIKCRVWATAFRWGFLDIAIDMLKVSGDPMRQIDNSPLQQNEKYHLAEAVGKELERRNPVKHPNKKEMLEEIDIYDDIEESGMSDDSDDSGDKSTEEEEEEEETDYDENPYHHALRQVPSFKKQKQ